MAHPLRRSIHLLRSTLLLVRTRQFGELGQKLLHRIADDTSLIGLRLDPHSLPRSHQGEPLVRVREAQGADLARLLDLRDPDLGPRERHERSMRLRMRETGIRTCYIAEDQQGDPCFVQWLILADQSDRLQEIFGGWYPPLKQGEAMLEFAYAPPSRRGQGVMATATPQILGIARNRGVRSVVTFIPSGNTRSLRIHLRMGFIPYLLHIERRRFGLLRRKFVPIGSLHEIDRFIEGFDVGQFEDKDGKPNG